MNLNNITLRAADYKLMLILAGVTTPFLLLTVDSFSYSSESEDETVYAVGEEDPIAEKSNNNKYSGKLSIQNGEMAAIMSVAGLTNVNQVRGATLAITALAGPFKRTWTGVNFNTESFDIKAKDKMSLVNVDWKSIKAI